MGRLEQIWIKRAHRGLIDPARKAVLEAGKGLLGSANYGGRRQVTIISVERWAELMVLLGADIHPSARRANLLVSGVELAETRDRALRVGSCRLLIGGETRPCGRMEEARRLAGGDAKPLGWRGVGAGREWRRDSRRRRGRVGVVTRSTRLSSCR